MEKKRAQFPIRILVTGLILVIFLCLSAELSSRIIAFASSHIQTTIIVPEEYPTIQSAIDAAQEGDVILVSPGVYHENLLISGKSVTLASHYLTTKDPGIINQTIIDGGNTGAVITIANDAAPESTVTGFTIQNGIDGIFASAKVNILNNQITNNSDGIDYENGSGGDCLDNVFENNSDDGIDLDGAVSSKIAGNLIQNNGDDGIEVRLDAYIGPVLDILIEKNTITGNNEDGIQLIGYPDISDRVFRIQKNLIANNSMVGLGLMDNGESGEDYRAASIPERIQLVNNTFSGNQYSVTGGDNLIALNNLFINSSEIALKEVDGGAGGSIAAYNLFWNNLTDYAGSNIDLASTIFANPMLDAAFSLMDGSPAMDSGTPFFEWNGEIILDLLPAEYAGNAPDMGWLEKDFIQATITPSQSPTIGPSATPTPIVSAIEVRIRSGYDDAEENQSGSLSMSSSDLEMTFDTVDQIVGMRFTGLELSRGMTITKAYIQFQTDEAQSIDTNLVIHGEASDDASTFHNTILNISSRPLTTSAVDWTPPPWTIVGAAGLEQRTSDISQIIQEIIDRPGWASRNSMVLIISGSGERVAESYDGQPDSAPLLHVEFAGTPQPSPTPTITPTPYPAGEHIRFAVIGDYGDGSPDEGRVATQVASWNPDFIITTGDNNYADGTWESIDPNIGQFYSQFIGDYQGSYGPGSSINRFWPSLGNHDWHSLTCTGSSCSGPYFDYFNLPGNERYYSVDYGLVRLFAIDSDQLEPDGYTETSIQATWLQNTLATSTACYNVVYFHHAPYSSGRHGSSEDLQWPFESWGADVVLAGHDHTYERLDAGNFPYFVNGAGGSSLYTFDNIGTLPAGVTSEFRYNDDFGAMQVNATTSGITYQFINSFGELIDELTVAKSCSISATATGTPGQSPSPTITENATSTPTPSPTQTAAATPTIVNSQTPTSTSTTAPAATYTPTPTTTPTSPPVVNTVEVRVASSSDDAEESASGVVSLTSSDLELVYTSGSNQVVGMRFNAVQVPPGASISSAYIQFKVDEPTSSAAELTIQGQLTGDAPTFTGTDGDISSRLRTTNTATWNPLPWMTVGETAIDQRSPDITPIIQEIIGHPGWSAGNSLVIIITGSGTRVAESYNGDPAGAALLHIDFVDGGGVPAQTATPTPSPTSTPVSTTTPTATASSTPTPAPTSTLPTSATSTYTSTPTQTSTLTPSATATITSSPTPTSTSTTAPTATSTPVTEPAMLYFSLSSSQTYDLGSAANVSNEDILSFDGSDFNFLFDGSDVGISDNDVDAFHLVAENTFLLSLTTSVSLDNFGAVDDSDILQFNASSSGNNTSGIWSMYFDGSDVGLGDSGEDIDAFTILSDGTILISTSGNFSVSGASGNDEDIILFTPTSIGNNTAGAMEIYFDSSDIGITDDIDGIEFGSAGQLFFSSSGTISPANITAYDEDILFCLTKNLGSNTDCEFGSELFFDGSSWGLSKHDLDAISIQ